MCLENCIFGLDLQVKWLHKKTAMSEDIVSDLVEIIFSAELMYKFNLNGVRALNLKKTKINEIIFGKACGGTFILEDCFKTVILCSPK